MLFAGPPGTGKTLSAQVLAHDLGLDLLHADLSASSPSRSVRRSSTSTASSGRQGRQRDALLRRGGCAVRKRSEVSDAHDRYANIETAYLPEAGAVPGAVILATNLHQNIDAAFMRRLEVVLEFP